ncbi:MAG: HAMP domain-containing sensor histidine kinase [Saprospiraceae bacterium]
MKIKLFTYAVLAYLLLASSWWTLLLINKNNSEYNVKKELIIYKPNMSLAELNKEYQRQKLMILGEGIFLGGTLLAGLWLIYRGNKKEIDSVKRQNDFLLAITHELKSPLSSIDLIMQTMKSRKLDKKQSQNLLNTSQEELKRLSDMIDNLLLSTNEHITKRNTFLVVNTSSLVLKIMTEIKSEYPHSNVTFRNDHNHLDLISCNPKLFSLAVKNIVVNAIKYGNKSDVYINVTSDKSKKIQITISDSGLGISDKNKTFIFDKFFRIGDEMNRDQKGTGIGLYISKKIITEHGGDIRIENNKPRGAKFVIKMPQINE